MFNILTEAKNLKPFLVKTRRRIHSAPELGMEEVNTRKFIMKELKRLGIPCKKAVETGVIGIIKGKKPGKTILLRADMDALPINEENACSYRSKNKNVMHACGHDAHVACLLGTALLLVKHKNSLAGNVKLAFQPREELRDTPYDPAEMMVKRGILKNPKVDICAALHVEPSVPAGKVKVVHGPMFANGDVFTIKIKGVGSHGSEPQNAKDPVYAAACVIQALQSAVSRSNDPREAAVVSVTMVNGGSASNIIPSEVILGGTTRTLSDKTNKLIQSAMIRIAKKTCEALGLTAEVTFKKGYPAFGNDENTASLFEKSAAKVIGEGNIIKGHKASMGCENFAFFAKGAPSVFVWLGCSKGKGQHNLHHPKFDIDENCLVTGSALMAGFVLDNML